MGMDDRNFIGELTELANSPEPFTDIRLEQDAPIAVRMPSGWIEVESIDPPSAADMEDILKSLDTEWGEQLENQRSINRPIDLQSWRMRINAALSGGGKCPILTIRRIPRVPLTFREVGLPAQVRLMLAAPRGLILIAGATRSGKSTSAAAMIDEINATRSAHVITIEDPIEYVFQRKRAIFTQREVGVDTSSFEQGLMDAMRQCPDVIMVGEIRNRATAETAIYAGESGHLVIGTLHANSATGAVQKLLGWFNDNERTAKVQSVANSLVGVISQLLLPKATGGGYALAAEVLNNYDQEFSGAIGDVAKMQSIFERTEKKGSISLAESLGELINSGTVAKTDAVRAIAGLTAVQERLKPLLR